MEVFSVEPVSLLRVSSRFLHQCSCVVGLFPLAVGTQMQFCMHLGLLGLSLQPQLSPGDFC
jgi:hypothetical protein